MAKSDQTKLNNTEEVTVAESPETPAQTAESFAADTMASQIAELTNDLQRTRADFENYRKQVEAQRAQATTAAKYATVVQFLPLIDDFERALATYSEQLAPLEKAFAKTLNSLNLTKIDSEPGTDFNPDYHEAVSVEDDEGEHEVIAETLRPGYIYDGNVIRAAMVKVKHV